MRLLFIDVETYSARDLAREGRYLYADHCEILIVAYALNDFTVLCWVPAYGEPLPRLLKDRLECEEIKIVAHNAQFEKAVFESPHAKKLGFPKISSYRYICTMALAAALALPRSLDSVAQALNLSSEYHKDRKGKNLINRFCKPRNPTKYDKRTRRRMEKNDSYSRDFVDYCVQDVEVERAVWDKIGKFYEF